jgi:teichuronic acid biosynthesis glycosyltransferase TuaC
MRVAVVTKHFPHSRQRWAGHATYQTLRVLATLCDLHVFYPEATYPSFLTPPSGRGEPIDRAWRPAGIEVTYIPFPLLPVVSRPFNGSVIAHRLLPHVRRFNPDIVLSYFIYPDGYAAVRIARALRIPAVVTAVGSDLNRIPDALCRMLTRRTLRSADFVSTVSHDLCKTARLLGADPARSRAKLNGCNTAYFYPRDRQEARTELGLAADAEIIVYVGRLDIFKGLIELIDAVAQLIPQRPDLRCYMVGGGPAEPALHEAIARHNISEQIKIVSPISTDRVALWMTAGNLVTLPSYNEGCPNVVVEALNAGRPVVATHVGGIPELVDDTCGRLVPPRDVPALVQALNEVLNQPWDATDICSKHRRSWDDVAAELYHILEEAIRHH